jgi:hypothetical protein
MNNPNQVVASRIVSKLEADNILLQASTAGLADKLSTGRVSSSDWITLFGVDTKAREEHAKDKTQEH